MNKEALSALSEAATKLVAPLAGAVLSLRVADVRQPEGRDPVISFSLNGKSIEIAGAKNAIGRIDAFTPGASKSDLEKAGIRIGSEALVRFKSVKASARFVEGKQDPLTGVTTGGDVYVDASGMLDAFKVTVAAKTFAEMAATGAGLELPAAT